MLQFLLFLPLFALVAGVVTVVLLVVSIRRGLGRLRQAVGGTGQGRDKHTAGSSRQRKRGQRGGSGAVIVRDTRPPQVAGRRIFADDEGEYVSFKEM